MFRNNTPQIIAVIDLGSNTLRMNIVRVSPDGSFELLTQEKEMVQPGEGSFLDNILRQEAMTRTLEVLKAYAEIIREYKVDQCLAVATSAVRDAKNAKEFLAEVAKSTGIVFSSISGKEEARLIYKGVLQDFPDSDALRFFVDIGGGSTEFIIGDSHAYRELESVKIGCVRMANMFMQHNQGTVSEDEYRQMQNFVRLEASHTLGRMSSYVLEEMIVSSGTVQFLMHLAHFYDAEVLHDNYLSYTSLCKAVRMLCSKTEEERRQITGMHPKRASIIIPAAAILQTIMEVLGLSGCYISNYGLREGLLQDYLEKNCPHVKIQKNAYIQENSVFKLAKWAKFEEQHARHVAYLALRLFDNAKTLGLHNFAEDDRHILYLAAILHDVGISIAFTAHDEHSYYLVKNYAGLLGFNDESQLELALLAGSHRMRENILIQSNKDLSQKRKEELAMLACFLKVAEALDRSHDQYVENVSFKYEGEKLNICVKSPVPFCVEQDKLEEGLAVLRNTIPALNTLVWNSNAE